jgi:predicted phosphate transport protein (TIGR00153 family)
MGLFKTTDQLKRLLDEFFANVEESTLIFKIAVEAYLNNEMDQFKDSLQKIVTLESNADRTRKEIETRLYTKSLLPQFRGDVTHLLEKTDDIIDIIKSNLSQFDVEMPHFPEILHKDLLRLTNLNVACVEQLVPAERAYFRDPESVKDFIHKVIFYEKEVDQLANEIKRKVFQSMPELRLSEKIHLRYFTLHIENISDVAETAADILSIMAIKRSL